MPRQLPWLNKGSGTRTQVKPSAKAAGKRPQRDLDSDDDFFAGTVLDSTRKGKQRADPFASDDDLSRLPAPLKRKEKEPGHFDDLPSSSPPPEEMVLLPPPTEFMHKGVDKFDLRDDEWMIVEDEFLETAQIFTRHLRLADYNEIKKSIAKKETVLRPIVPTARPSVEASFHKKAKVQAKAQKKAIDDVARDDFAAPLQESSAKMTFSSSAERSRSVAAAPSKPTNPSMSRPSSKESAPTKRVLVSNASDSDDLDAPQRPSHLPQSKAIPPSNRTILSSTTFSKPDMPRKFGTTRPRPALDIFDHLPSTKSASQSSISKVSQTSTVNKPKRSRDLLDDFDLPSKRDTLSEEQTNRLAKRKAEKRREDEREKRKSVKLDDIPTFLF